MKCKGPNIGNIFSLRTTGTFVPTQHAQEHKSRCLLIFWRGCNLFQCAECIVKGTASVISGSVPPVTPTPGISTSPAVGKLYGALWEVGSFRSLHLLKMCQQGVFLKNLGFFFSNGIGIHLV